jgi:hypothetical protein
VVDTSVILCALVEDQPQHEEYSGFTERVVSTGTALVYCDLLEFELADASMTTALKRWHGRAWVATARMTRAWRWRATSCSASSPAGERPSPPRPPPGSRWDGSRRETRLLRCATARSNCSRRTDPLIRRRSRRHRHALDAPLVGRDVGFAALPADLLTPITDSTRIGACRRVRGG